MQKLRIVQMTALAAALVLNTSCRTKTKPGDPVQVGDRYVGVPSDVIPFDQIDAGIPIGDRPDEGKRFRPDIRAENVLFGYDSSSVEPSERAKVQEVADYLVNTSGVTVTLEGHCDERGSLDYNLALGERRALAIRDYLLQMGVTGARITTKTLGEEMPAAFGHDESSYLQNRRGEFKFYRM